MTTASFESGDTHAEKLVGRYKLTIEDRLFAEGGKEIWVGYDVMVSTAPPEGNMWEGRVIKTTKDLTAAEQLFRSLNSEEQIGQALNSKTASRYANVVKTGDPKMDKWVESVISNWKDTIAEGDLEDTVYDLLDWLKSSYRAEAPEDKFLQMEDIVYKWYQSSKIASVKTAATFNMSDEDVLAAKTSAPLRNKVIETLEPIIQGIIYSFRFPSADEDQAYSAMLAAANRCIDAYQGASPFGGYVYSALRNEARRQWTQVRDRLEKEQPMSDLTNPETGQGPEAEDQKASAAEYADFQQLLNIVKQNLNARDYAIVELLAMGETPHSIAKERLLKKKKGFPDIGGPALIKLVQRTIKPVVEDALSGLQNRNEILQDWGRTAADINLRYDPSTTNVVSTDPRMQNLLKGLQEEAVEEPADKPLDYEDKVEDVTKGLAEMYELKSLNLTRRKVKTYPGIDWNQDAATILQAILSKGDFERYEG